MHACLNVDEIVRLIAHELVAANGRATAVCLACSCKGFEDLVLDALWEKQGFLLPLLKTFPGDVWKEGGQIVSAPTTRIFSLLNYPTRKTFNRLPTTTEWARFRKYAQRMREFNQYGTPGYPSPETLSVIQNYTINEPLLPNLKTLELIGVEGWFIPFIPLFLSPTATFIFLVFRPGSDLPKDILTSTITTLPTLCPNLQAINLDILPRDPMITAAVSRMLLATDQNRLHQLRVDSPLTEEANELIYKLPGLRTLSVVIERETPLPSASLPNLIDLTIICDNGDCWPRLFHRATFGKLDSVTFYLESEEVGDFLGVFEKAALSSSIQNTLSRLFISAKCSWDPKYSSLLPFTQLVDLKIESSCDDGCSSRVDDDIVISLSRAMPKLEILGLGDTPCYQITTGVTTKGLLALAHHCPNLSTLRVHLQVASLSDPPVIPETVPNAGPAASWTDCALRELEVGDTPAPEGSELIVALTLLRIFPRLESLVFPSEGWEEVENAINLSRRIINCSSKRPPHYALRCPQ